MQVTDCVGLVPVGFVDGRPYFGPFHTHRGRKMVGARHTPISHSFIYNTREESLKNATRSNTYVAPITPSVASSPNPQTSEVVTEVATTTPTTTTTPTPTPSPETSPAPAPSQAPHHLLAAVEVDMVDIKYYKP